MRHAGTSFFLIQTDDEPDALIGLKRGILFERLHRVQDTDGRTLVVHHATRDQFVTLLDEFEGIGVPAASSRDDVEMTYGRDHLIA